MPILYFTVYFFTLKYGDITNSSKIKYLEQEELNLINRTNVLRNTYGTALTEFSNTVRERAVIGTIEYDNLNIDLKDFNILLKNLTKSWNIASSRIQYAIKRTISYSDDIIELFSYPKRLNPNNKTLLITPKDKKKTKSDLIKYIRNTKDIDFIISILLRKNQAIKKDWQTSRQAFIDALEMNTVAVEESYKKAEYIRQQMVDISKPNTVMTYVKRYALPTLLVGTPIFYIGWMATALPMITLIYTGTKDIVETFNLPDKLEKLEKFKKGFNTFGDYLKSVTDYIDYEINSQTMIIDMLNDLKLEIGTLNAPSKRRSLFINTYINSLKAIELKTTTLFERSKNGTLEIKKSEIKEQIKPANQ
jgi:hypothetical protein